jgi:hypothetical protein
VKLTPKLLCVPATKICCKNPGTVAGCDPEPCPADPTPNQPAAVDHLKCYKIVTRPCSSPSDVACGSLAKFPKDIAVQLRDQFHLEQATVGPPQLLCAPVDKAVIGQTTSTVTTSSTTTLPGTLCQGGTGFPTCNGTCAPGFRCAATQLFANLGLDCGCFPDDVTPCSATPYPTCGGACLNGRVCNPRQIQLGGPGGTVVKTCLCDTPGPCSTGILQCGPGGSCPAGQACTVGEEGTTLSCNCTPQ